MMREAAVAVAWVAVQVEEALATMAEAVQLVKAAVTIMFRSARRGGSREDRKGWEGE